MTAITHTGLPPQGFWKPTKAPTDTHPIAIESGATNAHSTGANGASSMFSSAAQHYWRPAPKSPIHQFCEASDQDSVKACASSRRRVVSSSASPRHGIRPGTLLPLNGVNRPLILVRQVLKPFSNLARAYANLGQMDKAAQYANEYKQRVAQLGRKGGVWKLDGTESPAWVKYYNERYLSEWRKAGLPE